MTKMKTVSWLAIFLIVLSKPLYSEDLKILEPINFQEPHQIKNFSRHLSVNIVVGAHFSDDRDADIGGKLLSNLSILLPGKLENKEMCFSVSRREGGYSSSNSYDLSDSGSAQRARISYPSKFIDELNKSQLAGVAFLIPDGSPACANRVWETVIPVSWNIENTSQNRLVLLINDLGERDVVSRLTWKVNGVLSQEYGHCSVLDTMPHADFDRVCKFDLTNVPSETAVITVRPETGGEGRDEQTITVLLR